MSLARALFGLLVWSGANGGVAADNFKPAAPTLLLGELQLANAIRQAELPDVPATGRNRPAEPAEARGFLGQRVGGAWVTFDKTAPDDTDLTLYSKPPYQAVIAYARPREANDDAGIDESVPQAALRVRF